MKITEPSPLHTCDLIKWKHFPRYWPFVWGIHRPPVNSPHTGLCLCEVWCRRSTIYVLYVGPIFGILFSMS